MSSTNARQRTNSSTFKSPSFCLIILFAIIASTNTLVIYMAVPAPASTWHAQYNDATSADSHARPRSQLWGAHSHDTGAFANCSIADAVVVPPSAGDDADQRTVTVSCRTFAYRMAPITTSAATPIEPIVIGVLSSASGEGPSRREAIRSTWGSRHTVFFIVAGPWDDIKQEYYQHRDLIWLDQPEVYQGESSVLTFKTLVFLKIVREISRHWPVGYAFKTDDDCFVNIPYLSQYLMQSTSSNAQKHSRQQDHDNDNIDYWGKCILEKIEPLRKKMFKWSISERLYPEQYYPPYCQGVGFAVSYNFLSCAAGTENIDTHESKDNIANMRFMPFEDVAVGLLAKRCGIHPTPVKTSRLIKQYRTNLRDERYRIKNGTKKIGKNKLPAPDMVGRIVQHRIYDTWDMMQHFEQLNDPEKYERTTDVKWYTPKARELAPKEE